MSRSTIFAGMSAMGCRRARYGDFVVVTLSSSAFAVTAQEITTVESWARGRASLGSEHRDRGAFTDRFENLLARTGSGLATRGSRSVLARLVQGMQQNGIVMSEWSIPHNINESVEIKKKPEADAAPGPNGVKA